MKVAIISDIHGNIQALEAVLRDIDRQRVDRLIVNGDLVNRGPCNIAVMKRIWDEAHIFTLGNHDDLVRMWVDHDGIPESWYTDPFWKGTAIVAESLADSGWLDRLRGLPMTHEIRIEGAPTVLISHGSPRHYREGYGFYTPDECLADICREYPADILIGSHTHRPYDRHLNGHWFLNTGAVGAPFNGDPRAQYLILELRDEGWHAEFRAVDYDRDAALAAFDSTGFLEKGELSAYIFREELKYARPLYDPFWRWAEAENLPTTWESWEHFKQQFSERFKT